MLNKEDLKALLAPRFDLTDEHIDSLLTIATLEKVDKDQVLFDQGETAKNLYILQQGKVLLEADLATGVTVSLAAIKPGYIFGWSAIRAGGAHENRARAAEDGDVVSIPGDSLRQLMEADHDLGYRVMKVIFKLVKNRLDNRVVQFLKVLARHPDLSLGGE